MDDAYNYETSVTVRFRDIDVMGQVHHAVLLTYVEEARVRYFRDVLDVSLPETNGAIVRQEIEYNAPIDLDSDVAVRYRVAEIGESSLRMAFEVREDGESATSDERSATSDERSATSDEVIHATGEVVHVVLDEDDDPRAVPEPWADRIRSFESTRRED